MIFLLALDLLVLLMMVVRPLGRGIPHPAYPDPGGGRRTWLFLVTATINAVSVLLLLTVSPWEQVRTAMEGAWGFWSVSVHILAVVVAEAAVFWAGMPRVYCTGAAGIEAPVLAALCGWIPFLNIWYLLKIIRIVSDEVEFETEKWELDETRAENEICKTQYPSSWFTGSSFRDYRYINYWDASQKELRRNGATVYYGRQQSGQRPGTGGRGSSRSWRRLAAAR